MHFFNAKIYCEILFLGVLLKKLSHENSLKISLDPRVQIFFILKRKFTLKDFLIGIFCGRDFFTSYFNFFHELNVCLHFL